MEFAALVYFIDVICGKHTGLGVVTALLGIGWAVGLVINMVWKSDAAKEPKENKQFEDYEYRKEKGDILFAKAYTKAYKSLWPFKVFVVFSAIFFFVVPEKDTAYKMLAAYGVESIITNPEVQKLGGKSLDILNKAMDEYLQEGTPKVQPAIPVNSEKVEK